MNTGSTDACVTRIWSTCSSMLTMRGNGKKDEDELTYFINDSTKPLPLRSVLKCAQESTEEMLKVTVKEQKEVKASLFGDLYAHFLIDGHTHTTHYVSMSQEFPDYEDFNTNLTVVSSRCKTFVNKTKAIVLLAVDSTEKKGEGRNILKKLLERLMIDGNKVILLTDPNDTIAFPTLFKDVKQMVKEVSYLYYIFTTAST
jgi:hypothetical protein